MQLLWMNPVNPLTAIESSRKGSRNSSIRKRSYPQSRNVNWSSTPSNDSSGKRRDSTMSEESGDFLLLSTSSVPSIPGGNIDERIKNEKKSAHLAALQREANSLNEARKKLLQAMDANEARKQMKIMDMENENQQELRLAILKKREMELIQAADRRKVLEDEATVLLKQQKLDALECTRRRLQFQAAQTRKEIELTDFEHQKRFAAEAVNRERQLANSPNSELIQKNSSYNSMPYFCENPNCPTKACTKQNSFVENDTIWNERPCYNPACNHSDPVLNLCPPLTYPPPSCYCTTAPVTEAQLIEPLMERKQLEANYVNPEMKIASPKKFSASGKLKYAEIKTTWLGPMKIDGNSMGPQRRSRHSIVSQPRIRRQSE